MKPLGQFSVGIVALLASALAANADVRLALSHVQAEPGEQVAVPLVLSGEAVPGIVSLRIRILYPADWLTFVEARQSELVQSGGFLMLANVQPGEGEDLLAVSLAGARSLAGEGRLMDLVFAVDADGSAGQQAALRFTEETWANRGQPVLITESGSIRVLGPGDFDGDGEVDFDDFFVFADYFGRSAGEAGWDAAYDLDGDGEVGFDDFFAFADLFGEQY